MRLEDFLVPGLIRCRVDSGDRLRVLQILADAVRSRDPGIDPAEILDGVAKREKLGSQAIGKGLVLCHVRTERADALTVALATRPEGVDGFATPDGLPVRAVFLFLIPRKHSDLYLRVMAATAAAFSRPEVIERVVTADAPDGVLAALAPDGSGGDAAEVTALVSREGKVTARVTGLLGGMPPAEAADLLEDLNPGDRARCLTATSPIRASEIARRMHLYPLAATLRRMSPETAAQILSYVPSSRCTDILQRLKPGEQAPILDALVGRGRRDVQTLLKHAPHTAGGIMTPEVLSVPVGTSAGDALRRFASFPDRHQTDLYVTLLGGRLAGRCDVRDLLRSDPARPVEEVMERDPQSIRPERDQEDLRGLLAHNTDHSIPVVGADGALLGVVTEDTILDVVEQEAHEDLQLIVGSNIIHPLHTPLLTRIRVRLPWLLLTLAGELFIALVIARVFRSTLEKAAVLAAFIPAIMATGGNVGIQATALVIRGLGMGTLKPRHAARIVLGEIRLGFLLGLGCGLIAALAAYVINWHYHEVLKLSLAVFFAMVSATLATSVVGTLEPIILHRLKFDPATACGPFVTMFNDMFGSLVYMLIAMLMDFTPPPGR